MEKVKIKIKKSWKDFKVGSTYEVKKTYAKCYESLGFCEIVKEEKKELTDEVTTQNKVQKNKPKTK
jgi:hypothetical protein